MIRAIIALLLFAAPVQAGDTIKMSAGHVRGVCLELRQYKPLRDAMDTELAKLKDYDDHDEVEVDESFHYFLQANYNAIKAENAKSTVLRIADRIWAAACGSIKHSTRRRGPVVVPDVRWAAGYLGRRLDELRD